MKHLCKFLGLSLLGTSCLSFGQSAASSPAHGMLLVANSNDTEHRAGEGYLTLIDGVTGEKLATIPDGGKTAHEVLASKDGRFAYLPIYGTGGVGIPGIDGSSISVIDLQERKVVGSIDFGSGVRPHFAVWGPDGMIYVTTELLNAVSIVDPKTRKVVGSIPTGQPESHTLIVSHDGRRVYTANVFTGTVSVMDVKARKLLTVVPVAPQDPNHPNPSRDVSAWRVQRMAISNDDRMVFTCDWTKSELAVIDTTTESVKARVPLASPCYAMSPTPDGKSVLLALEVAKQLVSVDLATMKVTHSVALPARPQEVLIAPGAKTAFVTCDTDQKVAMVRLSDWSVEKTIATGYWPDGVSWAAAPDKKDMRAAK